MGFFGIWAPGVLPFPIVVPVKNRVAPDPSDRALALQRALEDDEQRDWVDRELVNARADMELADARAKEERARAEIQLARADVEQLDTEEEQGTRQAGLDTTTAVMALTDMLDRSCSALAAETEMLEANTRALLANAKAQR
jgi:hypothetical protein